MSLKCFLNSTGTLMVKKAHYMDLGKKNPFLVLKSSLLSQKVLKLSLQKMPKIASLKRLDFKTLNVFFVFLQDCAEWIF